MKHFSLFVYKTQTNICLPWGAWIAQWYRNIGMLQTKYLGLTQVITFGSKQNIDVIFMVNYLSFEYVTWKVDRKIENKSKIDQGLHQCDQKKSPNVYKRCPKMLSLEKLQISTPLQKLPKNVGDCGKLIVAKGFKKLPKVQ